MKDALGTYKNNYIVIRVIDYPMGCIVNDI